MTERADVVVVGGGIVGLATAWQLQQRQPSLRIVVVEREEAVGRHQSSHNSGVLHAGVYYEPGSAKAELCRRGKAAMEKFCAEHGVEVVTNGKLIVAIDESELGRFEALCERATLNAVPGLAVLGPAELRKVEPHAAGLRALHSPGTGVVDFGAVCRALAAQVGDVRLRADVVRIAERGGSVQVTTTTGDFEARALVSCAGLWADRVARMAGHTPSVRIVPFRGAWVKLGPSGSELVRGNLYPVPDPRFPFLGVHFTRRHDGEVWAGPNAVLSLASPRLVARSLRYRGFWRLAARYPRTAAVELWRDRVRKAQLREMQRYLPELRHDDVEWTHRPFGIRAQAVRPDGTLVDDFVIEGTGRMVHVLNAPSPAATSSLAIGETVADRVLAALY